MSSNGGPARQTEACTSSSGDEHKTSPFSRSVDYDTVNMLQAFSDASIDPAMVANEEGVIISVNDAVLRLFGYQRWEMVAQNIELLMPEQYVRAHTRAMRRYCQTGVRRTIGEVVSTFHGRRKDGSAFPLTMKVTEHWNRQQQRLFFAVLRDNTVHEELRQCRSLVERMLPPDIVRQVLPRVANLTAANNGGGNGGHQQNMVAQTHECTVAFVDLVGFTKATRAMPPQRVVKLLADIFAEFDVAARAYDVEPVKTIGDCYMYMSRRTPRVTAHAVNCVLMALRLLEIMKRRAELVANDVQRNEPTAVRIGIASGLVTAGVVTSGRLAFDAWGPVVNLASRLEGLAPANGILVSQRTYEYAHHYPLIHMEGPVPDLHVKGVGDVCAYLVRDTASPELEETHCAHHVRKWRCVILDNETHATELLMHSMIDVGIETAVQSYAASLDAEMWDVILLHMRPTTEDKTATQLCRTVHAEAPNIPMALLIPESDWSPDLCEFYKHELPISGCFPLPLQEDTVLEWIEQVMSPDTVEDEDEEGAADSPAAVTAAP